MEIISYQQPITAPSRAVEKVCQYLEKQNLHALMDGAYPIEGEDFFVNIFAYDTANENDRIWEAHRQYIDVHVVLDGEEVVHHACLSQCQQGTYDHEKDYLPITMPTITTRIHLTPEKLVVFYPEDAHQTGVMLNNCAKPLRKAVFKIRV